jgi:hypothetical protein
MFRIVCVYAFHPSLQGWFGLGVEDFVLVPHADLELPDPPYRVSVLHGFLDVWRVDVAGEGTAKGSRSDECDLRDEFHHDRSSARSASAVASSLMVQRWNRSMNS